MISTVRCVIARLEQNPAHTVGPQDQDYMTLIRQSETLTEYKIYCNIILYPSCYIWTSTVEKPHCQRCNCTAGSSSRYMKGDERSLIVRQSSL